MDETRQAIRKGVSGMSVQIGERCIAVHADGRRHEAVFLGFHERQGHILCKPQNPYGPPPIAVEPMPVFNLNLNIGLIV